MDYDSENCEQIDQTIETKPNKHSEQARPSGASECRSAHEKRFGRYRYEYILFLFAAAFLLRPIYTIETDVIWEALSIELFVNIAKGAVGYFLAKRRLSNIGYSKDRLKLKAFIAQVPIFGLYYLLRCCFSPEDSLSSGSRKKWIALTATLIPLILFLNFFREFYWVDYQKQLFEGGTKRSPAPEQANYERVRGSKFVQSEQYGPVEAVANQPSTGRNKSDSASVSSAASSSLAEEFFDQVERDLSWRVENDEPIEHPDISFFSANLPVEVDDGNALLTALYTMDLRTVWMQFILAPKHSLERTEYLKSLRYANCSRREKILTSYFPSVRSSFFALTTTPAGSVKLERRLEGFANRKDGECLRLLNWVQRRDRDTR